MNLSMFYLWGKGHESEEYTSVHNFFRDNGKEVRRIEARLTHAVKYDKIFVLDDYTFMMLKLKHPTYENYADKYDDF